MDRDKYFLCPPNSALGGDSFVLLYLESGAVAPTRHGSACAVVTFFVSLEMVLDDLLESVLWRAV